MRAVGVSRWSRWGHLILGVLLGLLPGRAASIREVLQARSNPGSVVEVTGVVTYAEPHWQLSFIQDETQGILFVADPDNLREQRVTSGTRVRLRGQVQNAATSPRLVGKDGTPSSLEVELLGPTPPPPAISVTQDHLREPALNGRWVQVEAGIERIELVDDRAVLTLDAGGAALTGVLPGYTRATRLPRYLTGLKADIRGVLVSQPDPWHRGEEPRLLIPSLQYVRLTEAALGILFDLPSRPIAALGPGNDLEDHTVRTRIRGALTTPLPGRGYFIVDDTGAAWVDTTQPLDEQPGAEVEAVGNQAHVQGFPVIRYGFGRATGRRSALHPRPLGPELPNSEIPKHGEWLQVTAHLESRLYGDDEAILMLRCGRMVFPARIQTRSATVGDDWQPGSLVRVQGTAIGSDWPLMGEARLPGRWQLIVRSPLEVEVLQPPSWWTSERLAVAAIVGLAGAGVAGIWVWLLGRQVRKQSETIAWQREQAARSEERARISRELHDSLQQHLTGLQIQLDAVAARLADSPPAVRNLVETARQLVKHGHEDTKAAIWELRGAGLGNGGLGPALTELAYLATADSRVVIEVEIPDKLPRLPAQTEHHLLRIAQEGLTNAIKHAEASRIELSLELKGDRLRLSVADDGCGFAPESVVNRPGGGFGLLGMRERATKIGARFEIETHTQAGTRILIDLLLVEIPPHEANTETVAT